MLYDQGATNHRKMMDDGASIWDFMGFIADL
jgi:hypothetical protein